MKIEATIESLTQVFINQERFYQIPDYQRPYSWDKEQLSYLVDDLFTAFSDNPTDVYFCGSLVLVPNESDDRFDIIDGQQRMTTFTILACVIKALYQDKLSEEALDFIKATVRDKYREDKKKLRFLTDEQYQLDFEVTVLNGVEFKNVKNIEAEFKNNRYLLNAYMLRNFIEERINETNIDINDFFLWLYKKVVLTVITCPSQDSAIQIFNVLNDRGMPLSPIDILKSTLMRVLTEEQRKAFRSKWEDVNSKLKYADLTMDSLLTTYLYYQIATNPKKRVDKELLDVFRCKESLTIMYDLDKFADAYITASTDNNKYTYCLMYLQHKIYWTSIIATAITEGYPETEKLKSLLVAYYYQNWVAGATVARIKQTSFNVIKLIKAGKSINDIAYEMKTNLDKYATTKTFKEEVNSTFVFGKKWDRALLLLVEYALCDDSKQNFIPLGKKLHLEHILPQTPVDAWLKDFNDEERAQWTDSLANLTLLSMRKNIQASNLPFAEKVTAYKNKDNVVTAFQLTQNILSANSWNVEALEKRKNELNEVIMKHLDVF